MVRTMVATTRDWERRALTFDLATPELLVARDMQSRSESKFVLPIAAVDRLLQGLGDRYVVLTAGSSRIATYRSLYFDTPDLTCFNAHRCGRRIRQKVRVRHYPERTLTMLEVKMRRSDRLTVKARMWRPFGDSSLDERAMAFVATHMPGTIGLVPQVWVEYRRLTLLGVDTDERITIDVDLGMARGGRSARLLGAAIAEVKQPRVQTGTVAMTVLRDLKARPGSASKYCAAMTVTCPALRANRVREDLRLWNVVGIWVS